jgi:hypothetical protein
VFCGFFFFFFFCAKYCMAPMVDGSDLPFRSFCRQFGTQLCYSPMVSAKAFCMYVKSKKVLSPMFDTESGDRPLIFQLSGNDPQLVAQAAKIAEPFCDGVDLNLGCPQYIAQRSRYGAFLMSEPALVEQVVRAMAAVLTTAMVCVKVGKAQFFFKVVVLIVLQDPRAAFFGRDCGLCCDAGARGLSAVDCARPHEGAARRQSGRRRLEQDRGGAAGRRHSGAGQRQHQNVRRRGEMHRGHGLRGSHERVDAAA